ncbi:23995_t:CDS:1, partial [Racocetra persica]
IKTITVFTETYRAKAPEKKDVIMDPTQLQLLFDKMSKSFEDTTKRILTANKSEQKELNLIVIRKFHGREDEVPIEWLEAFEHAAATNNWNNERRITIAAGYLSDLAAD